MKKTNQSRCPEVRRAVLITNAVAPDKLGGLERYFRELAAALVRRGLPVTVLAKRMHPDHPQREMGPDGVLVLRHDVPSKQLRSFALRYPVSVAAAVSREANLCEAGTVFHGQYAMPMMGLALRRVPYVYTFQAPVYREALSERQGTYALPVVTQAAAVAGLKQLERTVVRRATTVFTLSRFMKEELAILSRRTASRSILIPGGLDTERFSPAPATGDDWTSEAEPLLFAARRFAPRTGVLELIEAMPEVLRHFPRARLAVAGDGALRPAAEETIRRLSLGSVVKLLGRVSDEDLLRWYRLATISVMPTQFLEGFGLSTAESLACGTPVLGTPVGANTELLSGLHPLLLAKGKAPSDMSAALCALLKEPDVLADVRRRARAHVHPSMSWGAIAAQYLEHYARAVDDPGLQPPAGGGIAEPTTAGGGQQDPEP